MNISTTDTIKQKGFVEQSKQRVLASLLQWGEVGVMTLVLLDAFQEEDKKKWKKRRRVGVKINITRWEEEKDVRDLLVTRRRACVSCRERRGEHNWIFAKALNYS